jgi:hypothetical protein
MAKRRLSAASRVRVKVMRQTRIKRVVSAGCSTCMKSWSGGNAQGVAAKHHDQTGHVTWARVDMLVTYGG